MEKAWVLVLGSLSCVGKNVGRRLVHCHVFVLVFYGKIFRNSESIFVTDRSMGRNNSDDAFEVSFQVSGINFNFARCSRDQRANS